MNEPEMPKLEDVATWLGELQINLKMAYKQIHKLQEENQKLKAEKNED